MAGGLGRQERAVLDAIAANPFASQQEIASLLGLARSTVAAHIVALIDKGHVLGRGYVLPQADRVVCIGGAVLDRKYCASGALVPGTSNPVSGFRSFGGVARNVAENLARLDVAVCLVSMVGDDDAGRAIAEYMASLKVDVSALVTSRAHRTAEYVAVLGRERDLVLGLADMEIFEHIGNDAIERAWPQMASALWVFIDCNLRTDIIESVLQRKASARFKLAVNGVSTPKAMRLPEDLSGVDLLVLNEDEARAVMLGADVAGAASATAAESAAALLARGAQGVIVTCGSAGVVVATQAGIVALPSVPADPVDVTGAGDSLIAGVLSRLVDGASLLDAAKAGIVLAALTTQSDATVRPDLSPHLLSSAIDRLEPAGS